MKTRVCAKHGNSGVTRDLEGTVLDEEVGNKMVIKLWKAGK